MTQTDFVTDLTPLADWTVRYEVALRGPAALLEKMFDDVDEEVRLTARQRREEITADFQ